MKVAGLSVIGPSLLAAAFLALAGLAGGAVAAAGEGVAADPAARAPAEAEQARPPVPPADPNVIVRGGIPNARLRFHADRRGHVVFLGGSITEMDGYRPMVAEMLRKRFPETAFTFTDAGIASTCSTTGAFRLAADVLDRGPVDLAFVEFAVNDDQDAHHTPAECVRGMEGIVRHLRRACPRADVVIVYFVNEHLMDEYRRGETPVPVAAHEAVAERYRLPSIHLARAVTAEIDAGRLTWQEFGGVHPGPRGNRMAADMIGRLMDSCWAAPLPPAAAPVPPAATGADYAMPEPVDPMNYGQGRFVRLEDARADAAWRLGVPDWAALAGGKRDRFMRLPILETAAPGAALALDFSGTAVGAYLLAGPDAGMVEVSIDGGPPATRDLWHEFSAGLHYPRTVLFADSLAPGRHRLTLRVLAGHNPRSTGTAARLMHFVVNDPPPEPRPDEARPAAQARGAAR